MIVDITEKESNIIMEALNYYSNIKSINPNPTEKLELDGVKLILINEKKRNEQRRSLEVTAASIY